MQQIQCSRVSAPTSVAVVTVGPALLLPVAHGGRELGEAARALGRGGGTMGCHPMLTKNANFLTNAFRGDLSTVNVRNQCGHHT